MLYRLVPEGSGARRAGHPYEERKKVHPGSRRHLESSDDDQIQIGSLWAVLMEFSQLCPSLYFQKRIPLLLLWIHQG